jgi:NDP-sugar pyrophosphorylase family protein
MSEQALVAVGGTGSRLRAGGIYVPGEKSFIEIEGKPVLHWSLQSMAKGGIRRVVLTGEKDDALVCPSNPGYVKANVSDMPILLMIMLFCTLGA